MQEANRYAKSEAMPTDQPNGNPPAPEAADTQSQAQRRLTPEAERALAEAAARRAEADRKAGSPAEIAGRGGLDPTRYGDWEINGLTSDF